MEVLITMVWQRLWNSLRNLPIEWLAMIVCVTSLRWFLLVFWAVAWFAQKRAGRNTEVAWHMSIAMLVMMQYPLWLLSIKIFDVLGLPQKMELTDVLMGLAGATFYAWFEWFRTEIRGGISILIGELCTICGFSICLYRLIFALLSD